MGRTISGNVLSCDSVRAGAFPLQPDLQMTEEKVGLHAGHDMSAQTDSFGAESPEQGKNMAPDDGEGTDQLSVRVPHRSGRCSFVGADGNDIGNPT